MTSILKPRTGKLVRAVGAEGPENQHGELDRQGSYASGGPLRRRAKQQVDRKPAAGYCRGIAAGARQAGHSSATSQAAGGIALGDWS